MIPGQTTQLGRNSELRRHDLLERQRLDLGHALRIQANFGQQHSGNLSGALAFHHLGTRSAFDDCPMKQTLGRWRAQQHANLLAAT